MSLETVRLAKQGKIDQEAGIRDQQSIIINKSINKVWDIISDIDKWHDWNKEILIYKHEKFVEGKSFTWSSYGHKFNSIFQKIDPPYTLSLTSRVKWIKCIHVWKFEETEENQTIATIEESFNGAFLPLIFNNHRTHTSLLNWLSALKHEVELQD